MSNKQPYQVVRVTGPAKLQLSDGDLQSVYYPDAESFSLRQSLSARGVVVPISSVPASVVSSTVTSTVTSTATPAVNSATPAVNSATPVLTPISVATHAESNVKTLCKILIEQEEGRRFVIAKGKSRERSSDGCILIKKFFEATGVKISTKTLLNKVDYIRKRAKELSKARSSKTTGNKSVAKMTDAEKLILEVAHAAKNFSRVPGLLSLGFDHVKERPREMTLKRPRTAETPLQRETDGEEEETDLFGRWVGNVLKNKVVKYQAILAEKLIHEVVHKAQLGLLTKDTFLSSTLSLPTSTPPASPARHKWSVSVV